MLGGQVIKIWRATAVDGRGEIGRIISVDRSHLLVGCGEGALAISELQKAGGKRLAVQQFLAGNPLQAGDCFELA